MEYLALYRKYRPSNLDEVVGQTEIKKILASSVKNGTITHAYLFSGPRGTGKTTMAKILAKMVNCLNPVDGNACDKCDSCLNILKSNDVIEIDAASNNGVDEIRDLREKATLVPNNAKYKVYIIDEVHMLTTQAFNALLKILEEPPKHVIFVLATTEYYKIPLTITSRCQKFQFNKITNENIVDRLKKIAELENINVSEDALFEIAKISDGGMRDSINFLDQLRSFNSDKISIDDVYDVCGDVTGEDLVGLLKAIKKDDCEYITLFFEKMSVNGKNYSKFLESMIEFLKDVVLKYKCVDYKYIKNDIGFIDEIIKIYSLEEIFVIIEYVNELIEKIKNVSKQSIVITTNFLLLMNKLSSSANDDRRNSILKVDDDKSDDYVMAFDFTSNDSKSDIDIVKISSESELEKAEIINSNILDINKEIIINNTFAVASKEVKNSLHGKMDDFNAYLTDMKFKVAAGTLIDTKIEVAGENYVLLSATSEAVVEKVYINYKLCQELINKVFVGNYNFVVINHDEWNKLRDEYIKNIKDGNKYVLKPLEKTLIDDQIVKKEPTVVDKLFDIVGEDNVEFR